MYFDYIHRNFCLFIHILIYILCHQVLVLMVYNSDDNSSKIFELMF